MACTPLKTWWVGRHKNDFASSFKDEDLIRLTPSVCDHSMPLTNLGSLEMLSTLFYEA